MVVIIHKHLANHPHLLASSAGTRRVETHDPPFGCLARGSSDNIVRFEICVWSAFPPHASHGGIFTAPV